MREAGMGFVAGMLLGLGSGIFEGMVPSFHGSLGVLAMAIATLGSMVGLLTSGVGWIVTRGEHKRENAWGRGFLALSGALLGLLAGFRVGLGLFGRS